ncbi:hypothetical protein DVH24_017392 [Malus domestica]|uniref:Uncharacterized protein n=1 Tax=Malus domestica TaxID=3750 RepID=A0A498ISV3_MALDO|nr:hypothetical protein DVH24_017392 [Malus domestica]
MEFTYNMRGEMEKLHREMSNLRKVIKSCVDTRRANGNAAFHEAGSSFRYRTHERIDESRLRVRIITFTFFAHDAKKE